MAKEYVATHTDFSLKDVTKTQMKWKMQNESTSLKSIALLM